MEGGLKLVLNAVGEGGHREGGFAKLRLIGGAERSLRARSAARLGISWVIWKEK